MSLNLNELFPQFQKLGQATRQIAEKRAGQIPALLQTLQHPPLSLEEMQGHIQRAGTDWRGAIPTAEPIQRTFPAPELPARFGILATDGSQIYPDRHASSLFYLLNIGQICIRRGSGEVPHTNTQSELFFDEADLYPGGYGLIDPTLINARRDVRELRALANLTGDPQPDPQLALLDNSLLLWIALRSPEIPTRLSDPEVEQYLAELTRLRSSKTALAGVIDRPGSSNLVALLNLINMPLDHIHADSLRAAPRNHVLDRSLLSGWLPAGHRSARFIQSSPVNRDFEARGHQIHFFYLNPGSGNNILRVEIPAWVAEQPELLQLVHAGILDQCQLTGGFPYALARAHELAVVSQSDRRTLTEYVDRQLIQQGLLPRPSAKSRQKNNLSHRRTFDVR